ncbi:MAG: hypothetical protein ACI4TP_00220 [Anaerotignum sp.]
MKHVLKKERAFFICKEVLMKMLRNSKNHLLHYTIKKERGDVKKGGIEHGKSIGKDFGFGNSAEKLSAID